MDTSGGGQIAMGRKSGLAWGMAGNICLLFPGTISSGGVNSWNIFGGQRASIFGAFIDAPLNSVKQ
jgi:hypothetical protein